MKSIPYKIVEVQWVDSESSQDDWTKIEEVIDPKHPMECRSVGYLLADYADRLIIGSAVDAVNQRIGFHITIPKVAVLEVRQLKAK